MTFYDKFPQEFKDYLKNKYGNNKWWLSEDPLTLAYYQMNDLKLAIPMSKLQWAVEQVMERPVWTHQFAHRETLEEMNMYGINLAQTHNLCYEDILEKINQKWKERQNANL